MMTGDTPTGPTERPTLAYILKGYPRISETFISNEILLLEKCGFPMRLFPMRHPRENFCHQSVKQIQAQVDYLPTELSDELPRLLLPNILLAAEKPAAFRNTLLFAARKFRQKRSTATIKHLLQAGYLTYNFLMQDNSIRHLHGHFAHSPTSVTMYASMLSGLPFSFTAHAKDIYTSEPAHLREKIEQANFVVTCTKHNAEYLNNLAQKSSTHIHTIYHGIDITLFKGDAAANNPQPPYKLFTIARLTEKKGLPDIYEALKLLKEKGLVFHHTLIGGGDDREKISQLIEGLGLQEQCTMLGTQTHDEVLECFRQSDLFILGCKIAENGDRDGIPNVLVESLAMGVPAISTNVSAIPEILFDNQTGLTVPPSDVKALAAGIEKFLTDSALRARCIENGRKLVQDGFDNRIWTEQLAEVFVRENHAFAGLTKTDE